MEYISVQEAAKRWMVSTRQVQRLIAQGRIPGAKRLGRVWALPADTAKPARVHRQEPGEAAGAKGISVLPVESPNFIMSPFYSVPGTADGLVDTLDNPQARAMFRAQLAYYRGQDKEAERLAEGLLSGDACFEIRVGCALIIAVCSLYSGNVHSWNRAQALLDSLERQRPQNPYVDATRAALNGAVYAGCAPQWLQKGCFGDFSNENHPALSQIYAKWLLTQKYFIGLLAAIEPMITAARVQGSALAELYLRLIAASAYRHAGDWESTRLHIQAALALALPDKLYAPLAEYRRYLGSDLDEAVKRVAPEALPQVRRLYERLTRGFTKLHNAITGDRITNELTLREYELASLAVRGMKNAQIAKRLGITEGSVKMYFNVIYQKLGISSRDDLSKYLL